MPVSVLGQVRACTVVLLGTAAVDRWSSVEHARPCCRSTKPLDLQRLQAGGPLWFVLVNPRFEAPTAEMRAVLPTEVPMSSQIHNAAMGGSLVRWTSVTPRLTTEMC